MNTRKSLIALGGSLLLGTAAVANAESSSDDLRHEIAALKARLAEVEGRQNENWLNERRAEEVKALVHEVLADADTRASLMADGMYAGYMPGKGFHLSSEDGSTTMRLRALAQLRYIYNDNHTNRLVNDNNQGGFEVSRARVLIDGNVDSFAYGMILESGTVNDAVGFETNLSMLEVWAGMDLGDNLMLKGGRYKASFSRLDSIDASSILAVERGLNTEAFAVGRVEGVELTYTGDNMTASIGFNDGIRSGETLDPAVNKSFAAVDVDFAFTGRIDVMIIGDDMSVLSDYSAIGDGQALGLGGGIHYQRGESVNGSANSTLVTAAPGPQPDVLLWIVDAMYKQGNLVATAALSGAHRNPDAAFGGVPGTGSQENTYGVLLEAAYNVNEQLQPFVRYEWLTGDAPNRTTKAFTANTVGGDVHVLTVGSNYQISPAAKFTGDIVWGIGPNGVGPGVAAGAGGLGLIGANDDEVAFRAQLQLAF